VLTAGLLITSMACGMTGCGFTPARYHPQYAEIQPTIERVLLLPPEIGFFEELADGTLVRRSLDSVQAQHCIERSVIAALKQKGYQVAPPAGQWMGDPEAQAVQALFRPVNRSIQLHTYGPQLFPAKLEDFDYGIGAVRQVLRVANADALMLVIGHQVISRRHPKSWVSIALVEPGGAIIWYAMQGAKEDLALRTPAGAMQWVDRAMQSLEGFES
jgi:hypothetical protein